MILCHGLLERADINLGTSKVANGSFIIIEQSNYTKIDERSSITATEIYFLRSSINLKEGH